jgi:formylglycine-generating enzyme required for sulfatase activity
VSALWSRREFVRLLTVGLTGCGVPRGAETDAFAGANAGDERTVAGLVLRWCPAGRFLMGSPRDEPERRPGEDQVEVTLTRGFWMGMDEVTQGQWKLIAGPLPGALTPAGGDGDDMAVYNVTYAEAQSFCRALTGVSHRAGGLPARWAFALPTEAQWEYASRAGTTAPLPLAATPPTRGDSTTCRATSTSGAATGIIRRCRAAPIRIFRTCEAR